MFYENDITIQLKKEEQKSFREAYQIHNGLLYHYAKGETLWSILESDSFFARNIRFSNDSNEYMTGKDTIEEFIKNVEDLNENEKEEILKQIRENPMMYFMVCFCEDGDLLSQWRGYAKNGVSIGLDFTDGMQEDADIQEHLEWFCVLNNKKCQQQLRKKGIYAKYYLNGRLLQFLQMPYKVQYISKTRDKSTRPDVRNILQTLWKDSEVEERTGRLLRYIPFIKDDGFLEEEEYRLIFDLEVLGESKAHSRSVRSRKMEYLDSENIKKPYINVEFGRPGQKLAKVTKIRFGADTKQFADKLCDRKELKKIQIEKDEKRKGIYIGEGKNQETIMEIVEKYLETFIIHEQKEIKIWCDGHLPIREIVVGPGEKQEEMKESLEHFKNTVYWLRYIDIRVSRIPLRD